MSGPVYATDPLSGFRFTPLDSLTALYHRRAAVTHLVAEPVPEIIEALAEGPADAETLLAKLSARFGVEGDLAELQERLAELEPLGLVFRA
jgi:PqqD family protein of HPr-rel-A system